MSARADVRGRGWLSSEASSPRPVDASEMAWIAVVPCALATIVAIVLLGPPLGHALYAPGSERLWPPSWWEATGRPEPVKEGSWAIAALAPLLLVAAVCASSRWSVRLRRRTIETLVGVGSFVVAAGIVVALLSQRSRLEGAAPTPPIFGVGAIAAAAAVVLVAAIALPRTALAAAISKQSRDTGGRRAAALAAAVAFVAVWLLKALMTDGLTIDNVVNFNLPFTFNDALAVLNGRTPLVDYHVIYAKLTPYATSVALAFFGTTTFVYTAFMAFLSGLALLAVYAIFRRVTRSPLLGLALFLPFVATSDINAYMSPAGFVSPITLSAMWPMRYGGIYLLAWLTARHLDGLRPARPWPLFMVAGLVAIDTLEFGVPALIATALALLCTRPPRSRAAAVRLAGECSAGVLAAVGAVCTLTLVRAGALPDPALLLEWPRIFSRLGWFGMPLPVRGFHLAIYATFAAAIVLAVVRALQPRGRDLLTGMLVWSGAFGLLAGSYYVGRPDAFKLAALMSAWSFALMLLTVACVRAWAAQSWRRLSLPQMLVLFGFALTITTLTHLSPPQEQIARLTRALPKPLYERTAERFVGTHTQRGERVAILVPMSFRIAEALDLQNVSPYGYWNEIVTRTQLQTLIDQLRRRNVHKLFIPVPGSVLAGEGDSAPQQMQVLEAAGWRTHSIAPAGIVELLR